MGDASSKTEPSGNHETPRTIASLLGVLFAGFALIVSLSSLSINDNSLKTSRKALANARRQFAREHRPWVLYDNEGHVHRRDDKLVLYLRNFGEIPAANVRIVFRTRTDIRRLVVDSDPNNPVIAPGRSLRVHLPWTPRADKEPDIIRARVVYGTRPHRHRTKFCIEAHPAKDLAAGVEVFECANEAKAG